MGRGAKKGDNRFGSHQSEKMNLRMHLVKQVLRNFTKRKVPYTSLSQLGDYVAEEVNKILEKDHPETFTKKRGPITANGLVRTGSKYKLILENHMLANKKSDSLNEMQARILSYQLEISDLKDELTAHKNFAKKNLAHINKKPLPELSANNIDHQSNTRALDAAQKIIMALVEASDGVFSFENKKIINCTKVVNNVVADEEKLNTSGILDSYLFKGVGKDE